MGIKSKKKSATALTELEEYLRRDKAGGKLLSDVKRYVGELRQSKAKLNLDIDQFEHEAGAAASKSSELSQQLADSQNDLLQEKADHQQTFNEMGKLKVYIEKLEEELTDPGKIDDMELPDHLEDKTQYKALLRQLRRRMKTYPTLSVENSGANSILMFDIRDLTTDYSEAGYSLIGMFTVATCLFGHAVGFHTEEFTALKDPDKSDREIYRTFKRWLQNWAGGLKDIENQVKESREDGVHLTGCSCPHCGNESLTFYPDDEFYDEEDDFE